MREAMGAGCGDSFGKREVLSNIMSCSGSPVGLQTVRRPGFGGNFVRAARFAAQKDSSAFV